MALPAYGAIRTIAARAEVGANAALNLFFGQGRAPDEVRLVERMLAGIESAISGQRVRGLSWEAGTLSSLQRNAAEMKYGADFLGVFEARLPDYRVSKGFLAQAKLFRTGRNLDGPERKRLREQCSKMLARTPDSYVFMLFENGVKIVPAISVVAGDNQPDDLYFRGVRRFFEEHFACFIGDGVLRTPNASALDDVGELQARFDARRMLYITAREDLGGVGQRLEDLGSSSTHD